MPAGITIHPALYRLDEYGLAPGRVWYVDLDNGDDNNNGRDPNEAFRNIQTALNNTKPGDKVIVFGASDIMNPNTDQYDINFMADSTEIIFCGNMFAPANATSHFISFNGKNNCRISGEAYINVDNTIAGAPSQMDKPVIVVSGIGNEICMSEGSKLLVFTFGNMNLSEAVCLTDSHGGFTFNNIIKRIVISGCAYGVKAVSGGGMGVTENKVVLCEFDHYEDGQGVWIDSALGSDARLYWYKCAFKEDVAPYTDPNNVGKHNLNYYRGDDVDSNGDGLVDSPSYDVVQYADESYIYMDSKPKGGGDATLANQEEWMYAEIYYVDLDNGDDTNDGKSISKPKKTIKSAILSASGTRPTIIYVWDTTGSEHDEGGTQALTINKSNVHVRGMNRPKLYVDIKIQGCVNSSVEGFYIRFPTEGLQFDAAAKNCTYKDIIVEPTSDGQTLCHFGDGVNCQFIDIIGIQTGYDVRTFGSNSSKGCLAKNVHNNSKGRTYGFAIISGGNPLHNTFINCTGVGDFQETPLDPNSGYTTLIDCAIDGKYTKNDNVIGTRFVRTQINIETPAGTATFKNLYSGTATSGETGADILTLDENDVNTIQAILIDISNATNGATITIRGYYDFRRQNPTSPANWKKFYEQTFTVGTDPDIVPVVDGIFKLTYGVRIEMQSDNPNDTGVDVPYEIIFG